MAEEQIDRLVVEVETAGGNTDSIVKVRKQLGKLEKLDLSGAVRQIANLRVVLGQLGTVDESVKSMLDNMARLGLRASSATAVKQSLDAVAKSARQTKEEIADVVDTYMKGLGTAQPVSTDMSAFTAYAQRKKQEAEEARRENEALFSSAMGPGWENRHEDFTQQLDRDIAAYAKMLRAREQAGAAPEESISSFVPLGQIAKQIKKLIADHQQLGEAAEEAGQKASQSLEQANNAAKKTEKTTSKLVKTFATMLRYRVVGGILREITQSATEGMTALGEFNAEFKDALNTYSASSKAAGGSIALTLAPLLEALAPLVEALSTGLIGVGNTISAIEAMIKNGSADGMYKAVKPVEQIREELAKAQKETRKLISGFDELNVFQKEQKIELYAEKPIKDELGGISDDLLEDIKNLGIFSGVAGVAGVAIAALKKLFDQKNKSLKEQTDLTKADATATELLGDVANAIIPGLGGLSSLLFGLGKNKYRPELDPGGVTVPAGEASGAAGALDGLLGILGSRQTVPSIDPDPLINGVGRAKGEVNAFVTYPFPAVELSGDHTSLDEAIQTGSQNVSDFTKGFNGEFDKLYDEIRKGFKETFAGQNGVQDKANESAETIKTNFGTTFDGIVDSWKKSCADMELDFLVSTLDMTSHAFDAFDNISEQFDAVVQTMGKTWDAFAGKISGTSLPITVQPGATFSGSQNGISISDAMKGLQGLDSGVISSPTPSSGAAPSVGKSPSTTNTPSTGERILNFAVDLYRYTGYALEIAKYFSNDSMWAIVNTLNTTIDLLKNIGKTGGGKVPLPMAATGGMVTAGEVFMARENGIPEYIGSFGSHTAVANNAQITDGIALAVESVLSAYIPQIITAIEENSTTVNIGDDQIARAASRGAASYRMRTGRTMF